MKKFHLEKSKLALLIRDNASNGIKACRLMKVDNFGCIGHGLHLMIGPFLLKTKAKKKNGGADEDADGNGEDEDNSGNQDGDNEGDEDDVADYNDVDKEQTPEEVVVEASALVSKLRDLAKYIKNSTKAKERVMQFGGENISKDSDTIFLLLDVRTRWNSTLDMLQSMLKLKEALKLFMVHLTTADGKKEFNRKVFKPVSEEEWVFIEGLCLILTPFKEVTSFLSGDSYPTITQALPSLRQLQDFLVGLAGGDLLTTGSTIEPIVDFILQYTGEMDLDQVIRKLKACSKIMLKKFNERFAVFDDKLLWVTFLDPRYRQMKHLTKEEYEMAKKALAKEVAELTKPDYDKPTEIKKVSEQKKRPFLPSSYDSPSGLNSHRVGMSLQENHLEAVTHELNGYLSSSFLVVPDTDPLLWWRENHSQYPKISVAARKWLCVPATSTPSERVFSHCGVALTAKRSRMRGNALMNQVLLKNNLKHVKLTSEEIKKVLLTKK